MKNGDYIKYRHKEGLILVKDIKATFKSDENILLSGYYNFFLVAKNGYHKVRVNLTNTERIIYPRKVLVEKTDIGLKRLDDEFEENDFLSDSQDVFIEEDDFNLTEKARNEKGDLMLRLGEIIKEPSMEYVNLMRERFLSDFHKNED